MTDECDKQMVLVVVSLIMRIQLGVKGELCLVKATQTGDKFIQADFKKKKGESERGNGGARGREGARRR